MVGHVYTAETNFEFSISFSSPYKFIDRRILTTDHFVRGPRSELGPKRGVCREHFRHFVSRARRGTNSTSQIHPALTGAPPTFSFWVFTLNFLISRLTKTKFSDVVPLVSTDFVATFLSHGLSGVTFSLESTAVAPDWICVADLGHAALHRASESP